VDQRGVEEWIEAGATNLPDAELRLYRAGAIKEEKSRRSRRASAAA
jgi:hypothetical protein